jgi:hypothetical protein
LFVICHFFLPFVICHLLYVMYFLIIFVLLFVFLALLFCLLFPLTISVTSKRKLDFFPFKSIKDTFQGKDMNCGQLLLLRITQPLPWWLPFWGNQTLIQMTGSESLLLSFYVNRNVVGKINRGIPMLLIQSNTIQVKNFSLIFKNNCT